MMRALTWVLAVIAIALLAAPADAQTGRLDRDFGHNGRLYGAGGLAEYWSLAKAATAVSPDGSIFVATQRPEHSTFNPIPGLAEPAELRHYLPDGKLDRRFGQSGVVTVQTVPGLGFTLEALVLDSEGRPEVIGTSSGAPTSYSGPYPLGPVYPSFATVIRYLSYGGIDTGFGEGDGIAIFNFGLSAQPPFEKPEVLADSGATDSRGRTVLIVSRMGVASGTGHSYFTPFVELIARLTPQGQLDSGFGNNGTVPVGEIGYRPTTLAIARGDGIALGGDTGANTARVARLMLSGAVDEVFGEGTNLSISTEAIAVDRQNRLLVLKGAPLERRVSPQGAIRVRVDGTIDRGFGDHGLAKVRMPALSYLTDLVPDAKGGLFMVGTYLINRQRNRPHPKAVHAFIVIHRLASGKPDPNFGRNGRVVTRFGSQGYAGARAAELDSDGHLVVSGLARFLGGSPLSRVVMARYDVGNQTTR